MVAPRSRGSLAAALLCATALLVACNGRPASPRTRQTERSRAPFTVSEVVLPFRACGKPQRVDGAIYASVSRGEDRGSSIVRYNPSTGEVSTVAEAPDPELIGWFCVNERWLVWSVGSRLFARRPAGGATTTLSDRRELYAPALAGKLVAWDDLTPRRTHQMVLRDLESAETTVIAPIELADLYNNFPAFDGDTVVWTDVRGGRGTYRLYDTRTGTLTDRPVIGGDFPYPGYPQPAGSRIYSINFGRTDVWDWSAQRAGYLSIVDGRFVPIVAEGVIVNSLVAAGGLVATIDSEQRLTLREADDPHGNVYEPVSGRVDFVQSSADGTLIAWREADGGRDRCRLFVIEPR